MKVEILVDYLLIYQDLDVRVGVICSLLIRASAYDLRYGTDDGFAEFGVKANIAVRITIRRPPIMVINIPLCILPLTMM